MLVGRGLERARIDALLAGARGGESGVLVLRGEPGIGKTALLEYAAGRADGFGVLRAAGVESESELPFSGLHELLRPVLHVVDALPDVQADALRAALALGRGRRADGLAVAVAALGVIEEASAEQPILVLVDDAQWLDEASADVLRFAGRRLARAPIALLVAARDTDGDAFDAPELPELRLGGLHREAAEAMLATVADGLPADALERVLELAGGNPLALREIPAALRAAPEVDPAEPLPVGPRLERAFAGRVRELPRAAQRALLVAAAAGSPELAPVAGALAELGLDVGAFDAAEEAHLIRVGTASVAFAHPLVRSAVYQAAPAAERRQAHLALAETLRRTGDEERHPWHLAAAATSADEEVAAALERAAAAAGERGGVAAEARALERAARLTPEPERRAQRLVAAARAARAARRAADAEALVAEALRDPCDERTWAEAQAVLADVYYWSYRWDDLAAIEGAAARIARADPEAAATALAAVAAMYSPRDLERGLRVTERAVALAPGGLAATARAANLMRLGRADEAEEAARAAAEDARRAGDWWAVNDAASVLLALERYEEARRLSAEAMAALRAHGTLKPLFHGLLVQAQLATRTGDLGAAYDAAVSALRLAEATGDPLPVAFANSFLAACEALLGREEDVRAHAGVAIAAGRGETLRTTLEARAALGLVELQLGRTDAAVEELGRAVDALRSLGVREPGYVQAAPELVEALVRAGRVDEARARLAELEADAEATRRLWALAAAARCRGLLAADEELDDTFGRAFRLHADAGRPLELARTQLAYGERLRRAGRRVEAREQLRPALDAFAAAGARLLADRAVAELAASGERLRARERAERELSPQELQVARAVARGATNKEAAAELFLSPKTIEFHLRNAYRKLGVRSRTELANLLRDAGG